MGISVLKEGSRKGMSTSEELRVVTTRKLTSFEQQALGYTKAQDDVRRYGMIHSALEEVYEKYRPVCMGIESYSVFENKGNNAWKTTMVYGGVIFWALSKRMQIFPFFPMDLRREFFLGKSGTKNDVQRMVSKLIPNFEKLISGIAKGKQEHAADATGYALMAMRRCKIGDARHAFI